jgi:hypothetical protein
MYRKATAQKINGGQVGAHLRESSNIFCAELEAPERAVGIPL